MRPIKTVVTALLVWMFMGCGGGPTPSELSQPRVVITTRRPAKRLVYRNRQLNLVKQILRMRGDGLLLVGGQLFCTVQISGVPLECVALPVDLWDLDVLTDPSGSPTMIVGSGGWGKPSVAVLDSRGTLKWRFDGGFDFMEDLSSSNPLTPLSFSYGTARLI